MAANNTQMLLVAALAGAGIAYGPTFVFSEHLRRGELVALPPAYRAANLTIQAVYPSMQRIPLNVRRFVDYLAETFGTSRLGIAGGCLLRATVLALKAVVETSRADAAAQGRPATVANGRVHAEKRWPPGLFHYLWQQFFTYLAQFSLSVARDKHVGCHH